VQATGDRAVSPGILPDAGPRGNGTGVWPVPSFASRHVRQPIG
jgi:hypothetical protein